MNIVFPANIDARRDPSGVPSCIFYVTRETQVNLPWDFSYTFFLAFFLFPVMAATDWGGGFWKQRKLSAEL